ncbi:MAG: SDR family oxidoreductase [Campylobacter sp.]|uniref:SDR family NAD(P)-dependent oxidoreductase n=1 Tax=Campylobacter sp. TaxID=205 RepID=UPI002A81C145|nr:SDR family oxidoreductase [Campylobacter sp.]MCI7587907.1 SDR family oxidoreductase [Campylobacter sp.]MDY5115020.1 SDR family oxidoreductase [Campylobacter sp.]
MCRVFIISGSSRGIGKALSQHYLGCGDIVVGCARSTSNIAHENYRHFILDINDEKAVVAMVRAAKKEFGKIDICLNNAGMASMNHILTTSYESAKTLVDVNFLGAFLLSREAAKVMISAKSGVIINFSSVAVPLCLGGEAIYAASKAACESLTKTMAKELASYSIRVNAIAPTPVQTDLIKAVPKDKIKALLEQQAIKRFGEFDDIINVIDFFISQKSDFITGQIITLGGVLR